jgi:cystathionine gamma-synthase
VPPIHVASTFVQPGAGEWGEFDYSRSGNPTRKSLETTLASLESGCGALAFASGMAATDAVLRLLGPGDHLILADDVYGGTFRLVAKVLAAAGLEYTTVDLTDLDVVARAFTDRTRMVWVETPSNPLLKVVDLAALAEVTHSHGARLVADNTFATPYLTRAVEHGCDLVVHSTTKYLGGHSDVVGGAVCCDAETAEQLAFLQNAAGAVPGPFDCWLTLRGIKTLGVRMDRHCANAAAVAEFLDAHPAVDLVLYPGLVEHPGHGTATKQMRDFGGMVSFLAKGGRDAAFRIAERTRVFTLAESLGAVESLIEHPGAMTHLSAAGSPLEVDPALVRLSVGIETVEDLLADLDAALG